MAAAKEFDKKILKVGAIAFVFLMAVSLIPTVPLTAPSPRQFSIYVPENYWALSSEEQGALRREWEKEEGVETVELEIETFKNLYPPLSHILFRPFAKGVDIEYLGRFTPDRPILHAEDRVEWKDWYRPLDTELEGSTLTVTVVRDISGFVITAILLTFAIAVVSIIIGFLWAEVTLRRPSRNPCGH